MGSFRQARNLFHAFDECANLNARLEARVWKHSCARMFFSGGHFWSLLHSHLTITRPQRADAVHDSNMHEKGKRSLLGGVL